LLWWRQKRQWREKKKRKETKRTKKGTEERGTNGEEEFGVSMVIKLNFVTFTQQVNAFGMRKLKNTSIEGRISDSSFDSSLFSWRIACQCCA